MTYKPEKVILWTCDKISCGRLNRRVIPADAKLFDDVCEFCGKRIHEPLTDTINLDEKKHDRTDKRNNPGNTQDA